MKLISFIIQIDSFQPLHVVLNLLLRLSNRSQLRPDLQVLPRQLQHRRLRLQLDRLLLDLQLHNQRSSGPLQELSVGYQGRNLLSGRERKCAGSQGSGELGIDNEKAWKWKVTNLKVYMQYLNQKVKDYLFLSSNHQIPISILRVSSEAAGRRPPSSWPSSPSSFFFFSALLSSLLVLGQFFQSGEGRLEIH